MSLQNNATARVITKRWRVLEKGDLDGSLGMNREVGVVVGDIDRSAPVIVRRERVIAAPRAVVWALHTNVEEWPAWQSDIGSVTLNGMFAAGRSFTWTTQGLDEAVTSTIYAVEPEGSTLWGGPSSGITGVHRWNFTSNATGTHAVTEESWAGEPVNADPAQATHMLERSLRRWLDFLEAAATGATKDAKNLLLK
jgi:uncharacterized protein YndB with AHSA1/START domain